MKKIVAKDLYGWDELGICLSFGLFRSAIMCEKFPNKNINFLINDCDGISSYKDKKEKLEIIEDKGNEKIWSFFDWYFPFRPIIHLFKSHELSKFYCKKLADETTSWLRKNTDSPRHKLIINDKLPLIGKDLEFSKYNELKQILVSEYIKEISWAKNFATSLETEKRAEHLIRYIKDIKVNKVVDLQISIAKEILGDRIKNLKISTFSDFYSLKNLHLPQHSLLRIFLNKPEETIKLFNKMFSTVGVKTNLEEVPYWGIREENGHWIRESIKINNLDRLDIYQAITPKAMALYVQSKLIGSTYCSTAPNIELANKFCSLLNFGSHPLVFSKISFLKKTKWKTKINSAPSNKYQEKAEQMLIKKSDEFWRNRLPLVFTYIAGGTTLIDKVISCSKFKVSDSQPSWSKLIKI